MSRRKASCCLNFVAFQLKFLNFLQTFVGVSIIIYSLWMLNHWHKHAQISPMAPSPQNYDHYLPDSAVLVAGADNVAIPANVLSAKPGIRAFSVIENGLDLIPKLPAPWFIYFLMGTGIALCSLTCAGHIATEAINGCCLCFYATLVTGFILLEAALVAYLICDKHWADVLPYDRTGELDRLISFFKDNTDICKCVGIAVLVIQAFSLVLALILRAMVSPSIEDYDSDDDLAFSRGSVRQPLINSQADHISSSTPFESRGTHSDFWSIRMREKYGLIPSNLMHNHLTDPHASGENGGRCCVL